MPRILSHPTLHRLADYDYDSDYDSYYDYDNDNDNVAGNIPYLTFFAQ